MLMPQDRAFQPVSQLALLFENGVLYIHHLQHAAILTIVLNQAEVLFSGSRRRKRSGHLFFNSFSLSRIKRVDSTSSLLY